MTRTSVLFDLADPQSTVVAEVLTNTTCKRILAVLAEHEMSVSELVEKMHLPVSTVDYTVKKLHRAGFIEQADFLWSVKGKKVPSYKVSDKRIIIAPRYLMKGLLPALLISGLGAVGVYQVTKPLPELVYPVSEAYSAGAMIASSTASKADVLVQPLQDTLSHSALWFLSGALLALLVLVCYNWRKL